MEVRRFLPPPRALIDQAGGLGFLDWVRLPHTPHYNRQGIVALAD